MNQALMNLVCLKTSWNSMFLYIFLVFGFSSLFYFAGARSFLRWALNTVKFLVVCMRLTILLYASCIVYTLTTSPPCSDEKALQAIDKLVSRSDQIFFPSDLIHVKCPNSPFNHLPLSVNLRETWVEGREIWVTCKREMPLPEALPHHCHHFPSLSLQSTCL